MSCSSNMMSTCLQPCSSMLASISDCYLHVKTPTRSVRVHKCGEWATVVDGDLGTQPAACVPLACRLQEELDAARGGRPASPSLGAARRQSSLAGAHHGRPSMAEPHGRPSFLPAALGDAGSGMLLWVLLHGS